MNDVSHYEREQREDELRRIRDFYGSILDNIVDGVWVADASDRIFYANRGMAAIAGIPAEQIIGANVLESFPESALAHFRPHYLRAKCGSTPMRYEAVSIVTPGGRETFQSGWLVPLSEGGVLKSIICTVEDITARKQTEDELRESERRLRLVTDALPVLISYVDADGRYQFANQSYERWFGISRDQIIGHPVAEVVGEQAYEQVRDYLQRALAGERVRYLAHMPYQRGSQRDTETVCIPHTAENGKVLGFYALVQDVSELMEHKRSEEALSETNRQLQMALAELRTKQEQAIQTEKIVALGTMAAGIAHELNNPLMGIMGYVSFVRQHPADPKANELLTGAEQELGRMRDLIRSMLAFARPSNGSPSLLDIPCLFSHPIELLGADLKTRGITMDVIMEGDLSQVFATAQLEQAILNLVLNARDAVSNAREKKIAIHAWSKGEHVFIEIADTGPGVPDGIRNRIFDPFFTTKRPGEGTGLGLSVSRTIIRDVGGELTLCSQEGEGARFLIRLNKRKTPV